MPESVKVLDRQSACVVIFEAMVKACPKNRDVFELFNIPLNGDATRAEVTLTVNGIEVPVLDTLNHYWAQFDEQVKKDAQVLAEEMVTGAGLRQLVDSLMHSEGQIRDALANFNRAYEAKT